MKFKLTKQQMNNLQAFLERVDLKGSEVFAFMEIMQALSDPIEGEDELSE